MTQNQKRLFYSIISILFLSLSIFFRKKSLFYFSNRLNLILWFMVIVNLTLFLNLIIFQKGYFKKVKETCIPEFKLIFFAGCFLLTFYTLATFGLDLVTSINYSFVSRSTLIFSIILAYFFLMKRLIELKLLLCSLFVLEFIFFQQKVKEL